MPIKLRAHNLDIIYEDQRGNVLKEGRGFFLRLLYGEEFAKRFESFVDSLDEDNLVEIVSGADNICIELECPYADYCSVENYGPVAEAMASKMQGKVPSEVIEVFRQLTPALGDAWSLQKYGLQVGQTYRLGDIKIVNPNPPLPDLSSPD